MTCEEALQYREIKETGSIIFYLEMEDNGVEEILDMFLDQSFKLA